MRDYQTIKKGLHTKLKANNLSHNELVSEIYRLEAYCERVEKALDKGCEKLNVEFGYEHDSWKEYLLESVMNENTN